MDQGTLEKSCQHLLVALSHFFSLGSPSYRCAAGGHYVSQEKLEAALDN